MFGLRLGTLAGATSTSPAGTVELIGGGRPPLAIATGASAPSVTQFAAWLAIDVTGELLHDLVLAMDDEAVAAAAEHACAERPEGARHRPRAHRARRRPRQDWIEDYRDRGPRVLAAVLTRPATSDRSGRNR